METFKTDRLIDGVPITLPAPPKLKKIAGWDLPKEKQRFKPPSAKYIREINYEMNKDTPDLSEGQKRFIMLEVRKRKEGYWFFNNGNIEYVTGLHYFYLTAWEIPKTERITEADGTIADRKFTGTPDWTDSDRDYFYFWHKCYSAPKCTGMIHITNRRDGKTHRANATNYEIVSRTKDVSSAIQSKTGADAKKVFLKLVRSWQRVPEYYKPVDTGDSFPKNALSFDEPATRTTKTQNKDYSNVLRSTIYHTVSSEVALDGEDLIFVFHDEVGKTNPKEANVAERLAVVRECVSDGSSVTGKILCTTTVEEMERKGGKECKLIYDNSDYNDMNEIGQTNTGLYRYFKPAYYGLRGEDEHGVPFIDDYGYSDVARTKAYLLKRRVKLTGDALASECRKYPLTVTEAFYLNSKTDVFPSLNIHQQLQHNDGLAPGIIRRGNFIWVDPVEKTEVEFRDDSEGKWVVSWMPDADNRNAHTKGKAGLIPSNTLVGSFGVDPFDHKTTVDQRKSNAASLGFRRFNPTDANVSNCFVMMYLARPPVPEVFYEDIIKQCVFYGWKALIENNKPGLINYMRRTGFLNYVMTTKQRDYTKTNSRTNVEGIAMSGELVRQAAIDKLVTHIYHHVGNISQDAQQKMGIPPTENLPGFCYFDELLTDWLNFDINKWTDYDLTVASGITLLAVDPVKKTIKRQESRSMGEIFPRFNIRRG